MSWVDFALLSGLVVNALAICFLARAMKHIVVILERSDDMLQTQQATLSIVADKIERWTISRVITS